MSNSSKVTCGISVSLDGFAAGPNQTLEKPFGDGVGESLQLHVTPLTIGVGERLFDGVPGLELEPIDLGGNELVAHLRYKVLARRR